MSIIINGMDFPAGCASCEFNVYGKCVAMGRSLTFADVFFDDRVSDDCPLIEIPKGSGLIDAFDKAHELSCEDCISRQSAYEAVDLRIQELRTHPQFCKKHPNTSDVIDVLGVKKYIDKIQCVIPKRPTGGGWIK